MERSLNNCHPGSLSSDLLKTAGIFDIIKLTVKPYFFQIILSYLQQAD